MSTNGNRVRAGYTFDPEDARSTYRLRLARGVLEAAGVKATVEHANGPDNDAGYGRHACSYRCRTVWPEWVTDEMFEHAYRLADEVQTRRGEHNHAEAERLRTRQ